MRGDLTRYVKVETRNRSTIREKDFTETKERDLEIWVWNKVTVRVYKVKRYQGVRQVDFIK